ncbi:MAG: VOC family protein [Halieaceae bacterium]|nr:VOC family protein [Halieaceae bacterium]MCP4843062.1 VOC family protein [Halieaceae bacterium]
MANAFDRLVVSVPDLGGAVNQYQAVMGVPPVPSGAMGPAPTARWLLANTVVELVERDVAAPHLQGLVFARDRAPEVGEVIENSLGLHLHQCDGRFTEQLRGKWSSEHRPALSVDHVVLRTVNPDACIDLFRDQLGIRLALDKSIAAWGGRMLFFRGGKMTLEVIESSTDGPEKNLFWGVAYQCASLAERVQILRDAGVQVSAPRDGRKPGTRVATLKSHDLGIPTLLIQPAPS